MTHAKQVAPVWPVISIKEVPQSNATGFFVTYLSHPKKKVASSLRHQVLVAHLINALRSGQMDKFSRMTLATSMAKNTSRANLFLPGIRANGAPVSTDSLVWMVRDVGMLIASSITASAVFQCTRPERVAQSATNASAQQN